MVGVVNIDEGEFSVPCGTNVDDGVELGDGSDDDDGPIGSGDVDGGGGGGINGGGDVGGGGGVGTKTTDKEHVPSKQKISTTLEYPLVVIPPPKNILFAVDAAAR